MNSYPAPEDEMSPFAAIVLEMSDLLEQRPRDATTLSFKEREIIKEGLNYLELAKAGHKTVYTSGASIVHPDERLSVYAETSKALLWTPSLPADPIGKGKLFNTVETVLSAILAGKALAELEPDTVGQTRAFFRTMENYYFSGHVPHKPSVLDLSYDLGAELSLGRPD